MTRTGSKANGRAKLSTEEDGDLPWWGAGEDLRVRGAGCAVVGSENDTSTRTEKKSVDSRSRGIRRLVYECFMTAGREFVEMIGG